MDDLVRAWTGRLHTARRGPAAAWAGFDPDELARACHSDALPQASGPWALARPVEALEQGLPPPAMDTAFSHREWGPEPSPATVVDHDLRPGGHVSSCMAGPEGDQHKGDWRVIEVGPPRSLVLEDGFADDAGRPNQDLPLSRPVVTVDPVDDTRTRSDPSPRSTTPPRPGPGWPRRDPRPAPRPGR